MAHDYRTEIPAKTELAQALIFADTLVNLRSHSGEAAIESCRRNNHWEKLKGQFPNQSQYFDILEVYLRKWPTIKVKYRR